MIYIKKKLVLTALLLTSFIQAFAQPGVPGDCQDADDCPLPLDDWLIVLFAAGLIFTTAYLHKKQKKEAIA